MPNSIRTSNTDVNIALTGQTTVFVTGSNNMNNNNLNDGDAEFLGTSGNDTACDSTSEIEQVVICFTPSTRLATIRGEVAVEKLREGDRVITRDNGIQSLAWVGKRDLSARNLTDQPDLNPVHIRKGSLGNGVPERDMIVSPNHRMLMTSHVANAMFGEREVLVSAKYLSGLDGITQILTPSVQYIHLMFEQHEIVLADGAWTESFQAGEHSLNGVTTEQRCEIISLFPELDSIAGMNNYSAARLSLQQHEAADLSHRLG